MAVTVKENVFVTAAGWESEAITVIVAVPLLCVFGMIDSNRLAPDPLNARCALLIRLVFDDVAVVATVKICTLVSVTLTGRFVASSSPIVTDDGSVNDGAVALAVKLVIASAAHIIMNWPIRRRGVERVRTHCSSANLETVFIILES